MTRAPHIVLAGGGTPGNLYPGLAVAAQVVEQMPEAMVTFIGSIRPAERQAIGAAGFSYAHLPSRPAPLNALHAVRFVTDNVAGYWASRWYFREKQVSLVVGLGGAASAAAVRAGISRGIPTVILEQNVVASRVTQWLARGVTAVCAGFEKTRSDLPSSAPVIVTGNPARPTFVRLYRQRHPWLAGYCGLHDAHDSPIFAKRCATLSTGTQHDHESFEKRLVIIGGAHGARSINESIPDALSRLREQLSGWQIVHQSGEGQLQRTEQRYREAGVDALVVAYIDEMAPVMFDSDLAVCRPGGTTLAELALAGLPAILVPYPRIMDFHMPNAEVFASAGAATIIDETELVGSFGDELEAHLKPLLVDDLRRQQMANSMRRLARPDATAHVTEAICDALHGVRARAAA
jgi:UDP-N-acetylglucosamine--N-acetylmuramyl-(pentapeptide) pyrophosphoryl-undecaprenol N-acetylglucosamine transferase